MRHIFSQCWRARKSFGSRTGGLVKASENAERMLIETGLILRESPSEHVITEVGLAHGSKKVVHAVKQKGTKYELDKISYQNVCVYGEQKTTDCSGVDIDAMMSSQYRRC